MTLKINRMLAFVVLLLVEMISMEAMSRSLNEASLVQKHEQWMADHGRVYKDAAEKEMRFNIFKANLEYIEAFNSEGGKSYKLGVNAFTDLTNEEFRASRNGFKVLSHLRTRDFRYENVTMVPSSMDWRQKGAVTPVKDQGQCEKHDLWMARYGRVYETKPEKEMRLNIFKKNVELIESFNSFGNRSYKLAINKFADRTKDEFKSYVIGHKDPYDLRSPLSTSFKYENVREVPPSMDWREKGAVTEVKNQGVCGSSDETCIAINEAVRAATVTGYETVPANNEALLLKAVSQQPVSVSIDANADEFSGRRDVDAAEGLCGIAMQAAFPTA
ncbi:hypothetical protein L1987_39480 [Smallanthus sonchifolius]|uniref:Uncharacterized protein n=1 Tax=Smallanthus sonchifolius TaxID=185202 RepID=A0ACB9HNG1_9ASTR|nr:hypothetical protein L1987_39480 [Smallanthus sonchifolius]